MIPALIWSIISTILTLVLLIMYIVEFVKLEKMAEDKMTHDEKMIWDYMHTGIYVWTVFCSFDISMKMDLTPTFAS